MKVKAIFESLLLAIVTALGDYQPDRNRADDIVRRIGEAPGDINLGRYLTLINFNFIFLAIKKNLLVFAKDLIKFAFPDTISMTDEDRVWLVEMTGRLRRLEEDGKSKLARACEDILEFPNLITALNNSTTNNLESIEQFIQHKIQYNSVMLEILNCARSASSERNPDHRLLPFHRVRIPEVIPKKYNITMQNYKDYSTMTPKPDFLPAEKTMSIELGENQYQCSWAYCKKEFKSHRATARHGKDIHYWPKKIQCNICGKGFCRPEMFVRHCRSMHNK